MGFLVHFFKNVCGREEEHRCRALTSAALTWAAVAS